VCLCLCVGMSPSARHVSEKRERQRKGESTALCLFVPVHDMWLSSPSSVSSVLPSHSSVLPVRFFFVFFILSSFCSSFPITLHTSCICLLHPRLSLLFICLFPASRYSNRPIFSVSFYSLPPPPPCFFFGPSPFFPTLPVAPLLFSVSFLVLLPLSPLPPSEWKMHEACHNCLVHFHCIHIYTLLTGPCSNIIIHSHSSPFLSWRVTWSRCAHVHPYTRTRTQTFGDSCRNVHPRTHSLSKTSSHTDMTCYYFTSRFVHSF